MSDVRKEKERKGMKEEGKKIERMASR